MTSKKQQYEYLVKQYHQELYKYACWLIGDHTIAKDIVQETFLRAWRSLDSLQDMSAAKAWLITILRRENARRFERKQLEIIDIDNVTIIDERQNAEDKLMRVEIREQIMMLSEEYREPLMMQVVLGLDSESISKILNISKQSVLTRLFRARKQLKMAISDTVITG